MNTIYNYITNGFNIVRNRIVNLFTGGQPNEQEVLNVIDNQEELITEQVNDRYKKNKSKEDAWKKKEKKKITKQQLQNKQLQAQLRRAEQRIARRDAKSARDIQREERRRNRQSIVQDVEEYAVTESATALNRWARQFKIEGRPGIDIPNYLQAIRMKIIKLLDNNRGTKVKIYLDVIIRKNE